MMNELKKIEPAKNLSIFSSPDNFEYQWKLAQTFSKSDLVPKDYKGKPENILIAWELGFEVGLKPIQALQNIAVINGKPAVYGDGFLAIIQAHPLCEYVIMTMYDDPKRGRVARNRIKRKGYPEENVFEFSEADAKKARLWGKLGPWTDYSDRMLGWRALGFNGRNTFSDALKGIQSAEEILDITDEVNALNQTNTAQKANSIIKSLQSIVEETPVITEVKAEIVAEKPEEKPVVTNEVIVGPAKDESTFVPSDIDLLKQAIKEEQTPKETVDQWLSRCKVDSLDKLSVAQAKILINKVYGKM